MDGDTLLIDNIQKSPSMETFRQVLGVEVLPEFEESDVDPTIAFLPSLGLREFPVNSEVLMELDSLQKKEALIDETLQEVIQPLRNYFQNSRKKLEELTKDLDFIENKSAELNELLRENSTKLAKISPLVNDLIISPEIVKQILEGRIDGSFIESIGYLNDKHSIYEQYKDKEAPKDFEELRGLLELLRLVCIEKIKRFIINRIKRLRSTEPVSSQIIQNELLNVREIFQFILQHDFSLALELRQAYIYTIRWYYSVYFARYIRSLTILQFVNVTSQFALGQGLNAKPTSSSYGSYILARSLVPGLNSPRNIDETINQYFQIDKRISLLQQEDTAVMVSQIAENNTTQNYLEVGFKNLNLAILDNYAVEQEFLGEFFSLGDKESEELSGLLEQVFKPTYEKAISYTEGLISNTYDIFGILISICVAHHLKEEAGNRKLQAINDFLNSQLLLLWPKFQRLVDFHCDSLRKVSITSTVAQIHGTEGNPLVNPHELTVQFSKFLTSILMLSSSNIVVIHERSEPLYNSVKRMLKEFESVMGKCSEKTRSPKKFLTTNYMYLLNTLQQKFIANNHEEEDTLTVKDTVNHINELIDQYSQH